MMYLALISILVWLACAYVDRHMQQRLRRQFARRQYRYAMLVNNNRRSL